MTSEAGKEDYGSEKNGKIQKNRNFVNRLIDRIIDSQIRGQQLPCRKNETERIHYQNAIPLSRKPERNLRQTDNQ